MAEIEFYRSGEKISGPLIGSTGSYSPSSDYTKAFDRRTPATAWKTLTKASATTFAPATPFC